MRCSHLCFLLSFAPVDSLYACIKVSSRASPLRSERKVALRLATENFFSLVPETTAMAQFRWCLVLSDSLPTSTKGFEDDPMRWSLCLTVELLLTSFVACFEESLNSSCVLTSLALLRWKLCVTLMPPPYPLRPLPDRVAGWGVAITACAWSVLVSCSLFSTVVLQVNFSLFCWDSFGSVCRSPPPVVFRGGARRLRRSC